MDLLGTLTAQRKMVWTCIDFKEDLIDFEENIDEILAMLYLLTIDH